MTTRDNSREPSVMPAATPTMADVARMCGVSLATVSRAINEPQMVREATRLRVRHAMESCGYTYNAMAAALAGGRRNLLGLLSSRPTNALFQHIITRLESGARERAFDVQISFSSANHAEELSIIRRLCSYRVGALGFFSSSTHCAAYIAKHHAKLPPCLFLWDVIEFPECSYIAIDNTKTSYDATSYLLSLGHTRIALALGPYSSQRRFSRIKGYIQALTDAGVAVDEALICPTASDGDTQGCDYQELGWRMTKTLLGWDKPPTAILYTSDLMTIGGLWALRDAGVSVPRGMSVMGLCDSAFLARVNPGITSMKLPFLKLSELALNFFVSAVHPDWEQVTRITLPAEIVVRGSCVSPS